MIIAKLEKKLTKKKNVRGSPMFLKKQNKFNKFG